MSSNRNSIQRKPVQPSTTATANTSPTGDEVQPTLDANTIKKRRLETATILETTLDYASALVSTASTYTAARLSLEDEVRMQNAQSNPALLGFIEDREAGLPALIAKHENKARESPTKSALMLFPRFVASLLLFAGLLLAIGLGFVVLFFWFLVQICTGFSRWNNDSARMARDGRAAFDWFEERWRDIW